MKINQFAGKHLTSHLFSFTMLCFFISMLVSGCKKDTPVSTTVQPDAKLPAAYLVPDEDDTEYSMANYEDALNDVGFDGDRLTFNNLSHFVTTAMVLDSLGDSTADVWFDGLGFTNSLYDEFEDVVGNMPDATETDIAAYFDNHTNAVKYDEDNDVWDVNAMNGVFARLLNSEHKAVIGGNVFYSDYDVNVTVGQDDEDQIQSYATQGFEQDDENAIVLNNRSGLKTTAGGCLNVGWVYNMGEITCGSPQQKKATIQMEAWRVKGTNNKWYSGAIVRVWHSKRGFLGAWYKDPRGSQVGGVFQGVYFNQAKIYGNSAYLHEYGVYITQAYLNQICWSYVEVCVAPMCSGETRCRTW